MLRVVLGVALAAALLAVVTPALEDARATRTERLTERELDRVASAIQLLAREESPGARRTLAVSLPAESPTSVPLAFLSIGGVPDSKVGDGVSGDGVGGDGVSGNDVSSDSVGGDGVGVDDGGERDILAYRVTGDSTVVRRVGVDLCVIRDGRRVEADSQALVLHGGETYRLVLRLVRVRGRLSVVVSVGDSLGESDLGKPPPPVLGHCRAS